MTCRTSNAPPGSTPGSGSQNCGVVHRTTLGLQHSADPWIVGLVALVLRGTVAWWAGNRFPPAADGLYYDRIAQRIAEGLGSTWLWPDGKVTYAGHYPIGYPGLLAAAYRLAGTCPSAGAWMNAVVGAVGAVACYGLARRAMPRSAALFAGLAVAVHPGLVSYTPALMTEGVTAALLAIAAWLTAVARDADTSSSSWRWRMALGVVIGLATLVRPQMLVLAPWLGLLSVGRRLPASSSAPAEHPPATRSDAPSKPAHIALVKVTWAAATTAIALCVCAPWVARNCARMGQCGISFNGGWNLLIGAGDKATGTWAPVDVPAECATVWDEARKDLCFGRAARRMIAERPLRWLGLVPAKLAATFDYAGAAGFYLHASNPSVFHDRHKVTLGAVETLFERLAYAGVLIAAARAPGRLRRTRIAICSVSGAFLFGIHAYPAVLGGMMALALLGPWTAQAPVLVGATFGALATTVALHATFFGSGRYSMVVFPLVTALAPMGTVGVASWMRQGLGGWPMRLMRWAGDGRRKGGAL